MKSYNDIIHIGSSKPLICRDGNEEWSKSMDLDFKTYKFLDSSSDNSIYTTGKKLNDYYIIIDISVGWTSSEDMDIIEDFIWCNDNRYIYIRLVDQFQHQLQSPIYKRMIKLVKNYNIKVIGTYQVNYYNLPVSITLPYPYLPEDEINTPMSDRITSSILTGADIEEIYPMRYKLYNISGSEYIEKVYHPGYSGKGWNKGTIGKNYLNLLSSYKYMICTTCTEGYELLKYIECAEAGCVCIGEVPNRYIGTEVENWIIKIPEYALGDGFDEWFLSSVINSIDAEEYSKKYRESIKILNNKEDIKSLLLDKLVNG